MNKSIYIFNMAMAIFFWACVAQSNQRQFILPLDKDMGWTYETKGYASYALNIKQPPNFTNESNDSSLMEISYDSLITRTALQNRNTSFDTIDVFIEEIENLSDGSTRFRFNVDFVRYWGKELILSNDGYQLLFGNSDQHYLIQFPVQRGRQWSNKYTFVSERCFITAIDTTMRIGNAAYENCIEITIFRTEEGMKSTIKIYFSEEVGLVYYKDSSNQDELRLIRKYEK